MEEREEKKIMFEIELLEKNIELDSRAGYTFFSIMIPLSAGVLAGFLAFYQNLDENILPYAIFVMASASISPVIIAYLMHQRYNWATYTRINRIRKLEHRLGIENRLLFKRRSVKEPKIRVLHFLLIYIILFIFIWFVLALALLSS